MRLVADSLPLCYRLGADCVLFPLFAQRAFAAVLAICFRSSAVSFLARAREPFLPMAAKYSLTSGLGFFMPTRIMLDCSAVNCYRVLVCGKHSDLSKC
jgi:hypothetical protein